MSNSSSYSKRRRVGRFSIPAHLIDTDPNLFRSILCGLIIIKCELNVGTAVFDYVAIGNEYQFAEIDMGEDAPLYNWRSLGCISFHRDKTK